MTSPTRLLLEPSIRSLQGYAVFLGLLAFGAAMIAGYLTALRSMALLLAGLALVVSLAAVPMSYVSKRGMGFAWTGLGLGICALLWAWQFPLLAGVPLADAPPERPRLRPAVATPMPAAQTAQPADSVGGQLRSVGDPAPKNSRTPEEPGKAALLAQRVESFARAARELAPSDIGKQTAALRDAILEMQDEPARQRLLWSLKQAVASALAEQSAASLAQAADLLRKGDPEGAAAAAQKVVARHEEAGAELGLPACHEAQELQGRAATLRKLRDDPEARFALLALRQSGEEAEATIEDRFLGRRAAVQAGDRLAEWIVRSVSWEGVVLQGPGGRTTVQR